MALGRHEELTGRILKCAFRVQNALGCGFLGKVYENAMMVALKGEGLDATQQVPLRVHFEGYPVGEYVAHTIVARAVPVETKATEENPPIYVAQAWNHLKATGLPVGLLVNFGKPKLYCRRLEPREGDSRRDGS